MLYSVVILELFWL